ncbi:nSTAND1 domain-containing NTPase [Larkinella soli]|uniref:nSTAND1 domain-containing NTPase n=1 Tax=Larkinella soli TaxID=1770527 RepID=UPI000FFC92F9|nr:AAA family ATPase [Larkinella soli]
MIANPTTPGPFKFLDAYTARDRDAFFGRDAELQHLIELVFRSRLILVYGASGSGKTSLIQCGLAKALSASDYFPVLIRRRGHFPTALQTALAGILEEEPGDVVEQVTRLAQYSLRPVYLLFDQVEELFVSGDQDEQNRFLSMLEGLLATSVSCKILLVIREDYLAHLHAFEEAVPSLFDFRLRVEPMSERNLSEVITGTCRQTDRIRLEDSRETVQLIIRNIQGAGRTFQLPYLQVYLDRLWRTARRLQATDPVTFDPDLVGQVGPIDDVLEQFLAEQKEALLTRVPPADQSAVGKVLEAFVTYEGTRREHHRDTLTAETGLAPSLLGLILAELERARILRYEEGIYELAHDSLARVIDQSRSVEQRQVNDILRRLKEAYREYLEKDRADDLLLPQRRLSEIQLYQDAVEAELTRNIPDGGAILEYVGHSRRHLVRTQKQAIRRLRTVVGVISGLLLTAVALGLWAYREWKTSNVKSIVFQTDQMDPLSALAMSAWAVDTRKSEISEKALYRNFYTRHLYTRLFESSSPIVQAAFLPGSKTLLTVSEDGHLSLWDSRSGDLQDSIRLPETVLSFDIALSGRHVLVLTESGKVIRWTPGLRQVGRLNTPEAFRTARLSPDDRRILTTGRDNVVSVWTLGGRLVERLPPAPRPAQTASYVPDNRSILVYTSDERAFLWDLAAKRYTALDLEGSVRDIQFPGKGPLLALADEKAYLWKPAAGRFLNLPHETTVRSADVTTDGRLLLTFADDGEALLWDADGREVARLHFGEGVQNLFLSPDRQVVMAVSEQSKIELFNLEGLKLSEYRHDVPLRSAGFSPDGRAVLTVTEDGRAYIWDRNDIRAVTMRHREPVRLTTGTPDQQTVLTIAGRHLYRWTGPRTDSLALSEPVAFARLSGDGRAVVLISEAGKAQWRSLLPAGSVRVFAGRFRSAAFSPKEKLALVGEDGTVQLYVRAGRLLTALSHPSGVETAVFGPDEQLLTATEEGRVYRWNEAGKRIDSLVLDGQIVHQAAFSPDGRRILLATYDDRAFLWTPEEKRLQPLQHNSGVQRVGFSTDGRTLLSSTDRQLYLWTADGNPLLSSGTQYNLNEFAADGRSFLTIRGHEVQRWPGPDAVPGWLNERFGPDRRKEMIRTAKKKYNLSTTLW